MVLSQVQDDLQKNPELRKAVEDLKASALSRQTQSVGSRLQDAATAAAQAAAAAASSSKEHTGRVMERFQRVQQQVSATQQHLRSKAMEHETCRTLGRHSTKVLKGAAAAASALQRLAAKAVNVFQDEPVAKQKAAQWRQRMAIQRYKQQEEQRQQQQAMEQQDASKQRGQQEQQQERDSFSEVPQETALVLSNETAWDRFGSRLRDMPFLQNFFENPLVGQLFKETEIAASIREMKAIDPSFRLSELHELVQSVVAEHMVSAYLMGDEETLRLHCGDGAFAALKASIDERHRLHLQLDPSILLLGQVELVGARRSGVDSGESPWFVYTFECQQINCLRAEETGKVVQGALDDIRRVVYSIAISRHTAPETAGLLYPWMIREIAIVGNEPVW
ncbi:mitochondrial import inner membrane translocase subunit tim44 [Cyclospora cayetanensis]|uniref:Mitochondrial import inner membrane translocase subunit tim44 n=1 Tax=Cyclospora cayetanensis TaxID=88456 RepID=A0A6P6RSI7_9EIME|nr:mitochondrial import inner membrane translocase subunit tim44 [Cyclospora cayetanensis]